MRALDPAWTLTVSLQHATEYLSDPAFWTAFWELPQNLHDVFGLIAPTDMRTLLSSAPDNVVTFVTKVRAPPTAPHAHVLIARVTVSRSRYLHGRPRAARADARRGQAPR